MEVHLSLVEDRQELVAESTAGARDCGLMGLAGEGVKLLVLHSESADLAPDLCWQVEEAVFGVLVGG